MSINDTNQSDKPEPSAGRDSPPPGPTCCGGGKSIRWVFIIGLLAIATFALTDHLKTLREPDTPAVLWGHDYEQALMQAKSQNKPVLLAFHASWCPPCKEMKRTTYHDPKVIEAAKAFIPVMIDVDIQKELAYKYDVNGIPSYRILNPNGETTDAFSGYQPANDFINNLQKAR